MPSDASVHRALEGAREGTPTVLDIEGHAGFGKTHLIRGIVAEFPRERVLMATAYEDTQNDALGVLRQLGVDVGTVSPNALSASQALMRRIDALGGGEPVLLVIDDVHWADPESIDALGVLVSRMAGDRMLVVAAHRPAGARHARWDSLLHHLPALERVVLDGLDEEETAALLRAHAADPAELTGALAAALRAHTNGSPLLLRSLVHEYSLEQLRKRAEGDALPATAEVVSTMGERLARLDPAAVAALSAIAVLGEAEEFTLRAVADTPDVSSALELLVRERLVVVDRTTASARVRIFHGVVRAAVYDTMPLATRTRMHAVAAVRAATLRERLRHRVAAATRADDGLAQDLAAFAGSLHDSGDYREAARIRRAAAGCSSTAQAARIHVREADVESILALDFDEVSLDDSVVPVEPAERFVSGMSLAAQKRFVAASDRLATLTDVELAELGPLAEHRARVLRAWSYVAAGRSPHAALHDLAAAQASTRHDPAVRGFATMAEGQAQMRTVPRGTGMSLADLLATDRAHLMASPQGPAALAWRGTVLALTGMAPDAIGDLTLVTSRFSEGQMDFGDGLFHGLQGFAHFLNGEWTRATMMIDLSRAARTRYAAPLTGSIAVLASVVAEDVAGARSALREARRLRVAGPHPAAIQAGDVVEVLTLWFTGTEDERAGWLDDRVRDLGSPLVWADEDVPHLWHWAQAIGAQWAGRPELAEGWIDLFRTSEPTPWRDAMVEWMSARTDGSAAGVARLCDRADAGIPQMPTLTALLLTDAARAVPENRARREAAVGMLRELGAGLLASTLGEAPPSPGTSPGVLAALSEREREVALLVLEGLSYAQVATELFITRSTVSFHLSRIYAKTGTTSRHELIAAVRRESL